MFDLMQDRLHGKWLWTKASTLEYVLILCCGPQLSSIPKVRINPVLSEEFSDDGAWFLLGARVIFRLWMNCRLLRGQEGRVTVAWKSHEIYFHFPDLTKSQNFVKMIMEKFWNVAHTAKLNESPFFIDRILCSWPWKSHVKVMQFFSLKCRRHAIVFYFWWYCQEYGQWFLSEMMFPFALWCNSISGITFKFLNKHGVIIS